ALVLGDDAYDALPGLTLYHPILVPDRLAAGSRSDSSRLGCPPRGEEATLCWELRTSPLPARHVPGGYRWQNSGYGHSVLRTPYSYIGDLVSHSTDQAQQRRSCYRATRSPRLPANGHQCRQCTSVPNGSTPEKELMFGGSLRV